jgi:hypothetical protein
MVESFLLPPTQAAVDGCTLAKQPGGVRLRDRRLRLTVPPDRERAWCRHDEGPALPSRAGQVWVCIIV